MKPVAPSIKTFGAAIVATIHRCDKLNIFSYSLIYATRSFSPMINWTNSPGTSNLVEKWEGTTCAFLQCILSTCTGGRRRHSAAHMKVGGFVCGRPKFYS